MNISLTRILSESGSMRLAKRGQNLPRPRQACFPLGKRMPSAAATSWEVKSGCRRRCRNEDFGNGVARALIGVGFQAYKLNQRSRMNQRTGRNESAANWAFVR